MAGPSVAMSVADRVIQPAVVRGAGRRALLDASGIEDRDRFYSPIFTLMISERI